MNTNEELGKIAYEAHQKTLGECVIWDEAMPSKRALWESAANAVKEAVLAGLPKWVLLDPGDITREGDVKLRGDLKWEELAFGGWMVQNGVVRRLSSLVSVVPSLGTPEELHPPVGCAPDQGADVPPALSSKELGEFRDRLIAEQKPLPPDAKFEVKMDENGDLKPFLGGEKLVPYGIGSTLSEWKPKFKVGDKVLWANVGGTVYTVDKVPANQMADYVMEEMGGIGGLHAMEDELTLAPLPTASPSESPPSVSEQEADEDEHAMAIELNRKDAQIATLEKRVMEAEKWAAAVQASRSEYIEMYTTQRDANMRLSDRAEQAEKRLAETTQSLNESNEAYEKASFDRDSFTRDCRRLVAERNGLQEKLSRLSASPWIPISTPPKEGDGPHVIWGNRRGVWMGYWNDLHTASQYPPTHWHKFPPLLSESPEADPFQVWENTNEISYDSDMDREIAKKAYLAGVASTNPTK